MEKTMEMDIEKGLFQISRTLAVGYFSISFGWLCVALGLCWGLSSDPDAAFRAMKWAFGLWVLSVADILAIAKTVVSLMNTTRLEGEKRLAALIRTSYWGVVKLACLGLFVVVLIKASTGNQTGKTLGLLTGLGTLVVVPLAGGLFWSQRILRHARE